MIYASIDRLRRKLNARLKLDVSQTDFYPVSVVDDILLTDIIDEKESYVDLYLGMIYVLPLSREQPVVVHIVEDLVMSELVQYEYVNTQTASQDLTNFATMCKKRAYNMLYQLLAGSNVPIPEADGVGFYLAQQFTKRLMLPGEVETSTPPPRTIVNNDMFVGTINQDSSGETQNVLVFELIDKNQDYNPFSDDFIES